MYIMELQLRALLDAFGGLVHVVDQYQEFHFCLNLASLQDVYT